MRDKIIYCFKHLILFLIILNLNIYHIFASNVKEGQILILHSYHQGFTWTDEITEGIMSVLDKEYPNANIYVEYMDTKRIDPDSVINNLYSLYNTKFKTIKFDAIITSDDNAFNFVKLYRDEIFPGIPVVFCGVNYYDPSEIKDFKNYTGVVESFDIKSTIETAIGLHPETNEIFIINDFTPTGISNKKTILKQITDIKEKIKVTFLEDYTMGELQKKLFSIHKKSIVVLVSFNRDKAGKYFSYEETANNIAPYSNAPIYAVWSFYLDHGIVGGMITSGIIQGKTAAIIASRIIKGEKADSIPVIPESQNQYIFDYDELMNFNIDISKLPEGSILINEPFSLYKANPNVFWRYFSIITSLIIFIIILFINIIRRKKIEKELDENKRKLTTLLSNLQGMAYRCLNDKDWTMVFVSDGCYNLTGYHPEELVDSKTISYNDIIHPDSKEVVWDTVQLAISKFEPFYLKYKIITKSGKTKWVLEKGVGIYTDKKQLSAIEGYITDITDLKSVEKELIEAKNKAEQSNKIKTAFLASMSHELRTPLNAIIGFSDLISAKTQSPDDIYKFSDVINKSGKNLLGIIESVFDMSVIESGDILIYKEKFLIKDVFDDIKNYIDDKIIELKKEHINIRYNPSKDYEYINVVTDKERLKQIITNLLNNAIKFTHSGYIEYGFNIEKEEIVFYVKDSGIGIPKEKQDLIFESFYQIEKKQDKQFSGIGVGLTISSKLTTMLGGRMWLESEFNKGSSFYFSIPYIKV